MRIPGRWLVVGGHAAVVAGLVAVLVVAETGHGEPDANIGAGLAGLALTGLGLPWSLAALRVHGSGTRLLVVAGAAVLNVGIGAAIAYRRGGGRRT